MKGVLDSQVIEKFKEFQKKTGKYLDLNIENVEFENKYLKELVKIPIKGGGTPDTKIKKYWLDDFSLIDNINYFGWRNIEKDLFNNKFLNEYSKVIPKEAYDKCSTWLIPSNSILIAIASASKGLITMNNRPMCTNQNILGVVINDYNYTEYIYYCLKNLYSTLSGKKEFGNLTKGSEEEREISIPKDYNENYKSIDIQKVIVEFLEFWNINYTDIFRKTVTHQKPILEKIKKALIPATLKYDKTIVNSFNEFANNKGFKLELNEIKFENSTLGNIIDLNGGDRITKKNNSGTLYPVYGGGDVSFKTDTYNRENEYVIGRFAISKTCVRFVNKKFHLLDSGFTFNIKENFEGIVDKNFVGYFLLSIQHKIYACADGAGQKNLDIELFNKIKILFPLDKSIQALLVEFWEMILNNMDEKFRKFDNIERLTDKIDEAFLYKTFSKIEWREE